MHWTRAIGLAVSIVALAAGARTSTQDAGNGPPSAKEVRKLVERYVALDAKDAAGIAEQDEILARLSMLPPLDAKQARAWRKDLAKLAGKGPGLEKKSGRAWLWEEEERGFYILGGETRRPQGLFVGMHGGGVGSGDAWDAHGAYNGAASHEDWLAIYPQVLEKTERGWTDSGTEEFVLELVERALRTWKIDRDRVYLGGHSMGGYGSWTLGAHHADLLAGLAPSAGAPTPILEGGRAVDIESGVVPSLRNVRMAIFQSADDPRVPPDANRVAMKRVEEARQRWGGYDVEYWEVADNGHDLPPGGTGALLEKIHDARRVARPQRVVWEPVLTWKRQMYWLWWRRPLPYALVVADLEREANALRVEAGVPEGLFVLLDDELVDLERELVLVVNDVEVFRGRVERSLAALVASGAHGDAARTYEAWIPLVTPD